MNLQYELFKCEKVTFVNIYCIFILYHISMNVDFLFNLMIKHNLRPPPPPKKSIFVKKMKIEINAWEDSPSSALSETL